MTKKNALIGAILVVLIAGAVFLFWPEKHTQQPIAENNPAPTTNTDNVGLANPASVNCADKGGQLQIVKRGDGGEYGICYFEDNRQCEEWALMRGDCPVGGLKITGYDNQQQIFCAITGGIVDMAKNTCTIKNNACDLKQYFDDTCPAV